VRYRLLAQSPMSHALVVSGPISWAISPTSDVFQFIHVYVILVSGRTLVLVPHSVHNLIRL
jgi:hypothetical protein